RPRGEESPAQPGSQRSRPEVSQRTHPPTPCGDVGQVERRRRADAPALQSFDQKAPLLDAAARPPFEEEHLSPDLVSSLAKPFVHRHRSLLWCPRVSVAAWGRKGFPRKDT